jgi:hypothetical protein
MEGFKELRARNSAMTGVSKNIGYLRVPDEPEDYILPLTTPSPDPRKRAGFFSRILTFFRRFTCLLSMAKDWWSRLKKSTRGVCRYLRGLEWTEKKQHDCVFCERRNLAKIVYEV